MLSSSISLPARTAIANQSRAERSPTSAVSSFGSSCSGCGAGACWVSVLCVIVRLDGGAGAALGAPAPPLARQRGSGVASRALSWIEDGQFLAVLLSFFLHGLDGGLGRCLRDLFAVLERFAAGVGRLGLDLVRDRSDLLVLEPRRGREQRLRRSPLRRRRAPARAGCARPCPSRSSRRRGSPRCRAPLRTHARSSSRSPARRRRTRLRSDR